MGHSSGGALVAAIIGCRTDEEVQSILTPDFCTLLTPCCESWKTLIKLVHNNYQLSPLFMMC